MSHGGRRRDIVHTISDVDYFSSMGIDFRKHWGDGGKAQPFESADQMLMRTICCSIIYLVNWTSGLWPSNHSMRGACDCASKQFECHASHNVCGADGCSPNGGNLLQRGHGAIVTSFANTHDSIDLLGLTHQHACVRKLITRFILPVSTPHLCVWWTQSEQHVALETHLETHLM